MVARRKRIVAETDNSDWQAPKKRRKPRKPMSEEQRVAAAARLEKAREKRKAKDPDYGMSGIHESLRNLPDVHPLHPKKVKLWIKSHKDLTSSARSDVRRKVKGALAQVGIHEGYLRNLQKYLRDGDWVDMFYGEHQQHQIGYRCISQAYYWFGPKKGEPKFDVGTYYPLLGCVYTQEMFDEEEGISNVGSGERKRSRKRSTRTVAKDKKKSKAS
ncbi:uncharacterized protein METZ01_LOCUS138075 [marine metagenome]|uniref:Uncharacterized protein n=1 Tax=marine metagenome TaxID=408172 RepID=A0A381Z8E8_9ZZZZ